MKCCNKNVENSLKDVKCDKIEKGGVKMANGLKNVEGLEIMGNIVEVGWDYLTCNVYGYHLISEYQNIAGFEMEKSENVRFDYLICPVDEEEDQAILDDFGALFSYSGYKNLPNKTEVLVYERTGKNQISYRIQEYPIDNNLNDLSRMQLNAITMKSKMHVTTVEKFREFLETRDLKNLLEFSTKIKENQVKCQVNGIDLKGIIPSKLLENIWKLSKEFEGQKIATLDKDNTFSLPILFKKEEVPNFRVYESIFVASEDLIAHIAKELNLLTPPWRSDEKYNTRLVKAMFNEFKIINLIEIEYWINSLINSHDPKIFESPEIMKKSMIRISVLHEPDMFQITDGTEMVIDLAYYAIYGDFIKRRV